MKPHSLKLVYKRIFDQGFELTKDEFETLDRIVSQVQDDLDATPPGPRSTGPQIGYLAGLMDLEREDRLYMLEILLGFPTFFDGAEIMGTPQYPDAYPGPSSKDARISIGQMSYLIEYYNTNGEAHDPHRILRFTSLADITKANRARRTALRAAKAAAVGSRKQDQPVAEQPLPAGEPGDVDQLFSPG